VLEEALTRLGHAGLAKQLEAESGVALSSAAAVALRDAVLSGAWDTASGALAALPARDAASAAAARWLLLRHKLRERLEAGDTTGALGVLRNQMAPHAPHAAALHAAALLLLCADDAQRAAAEARADAADGTHTPPATPPARAPAASEASRAALLRRLNELLHPSAAVPDGRLEALLEQALCAQAAACMHHNAPPASRPASLLRDHACGASALPSRCAAVLEAHADEVWHLAFSHDGTRLASAGKDACVVVHALQGSGSGGSGGGGITATLLHALRGHAGPVTHVCWSPDDALLLSCSMDRSARLWDAVAGVCVRVLSRHADGVTAGAWAPNGRTLYTAGVDKRIVAWNAPPRAPSQRAGGAGGAGGAGTTAAVSASAAALAMNMMPSASAERASWRVPRVNDLAMSADGTLLAAVCAERRVRLWRPADGVETWLAESGAVTSLALSRDGKGLLLSLQSGEVHLWDLSSVGGATGGAGEPAAPPLPTSPALVFRGQSERAGRYVIRPCFGGADDAFVACGSEDSQLYVWHRGRGQLLAVLPGHAGAVNAVSWSATQPGLLASASDDRTVRLWASEDMLRTLGGQSS
jgi:WD40 repeat protein